MSSLSKLVVVFVGDFLEGRIVLLQRCRHLELYIREGVDVVVGWVVSSLCIYKSRANFQRGVVCG